MRVYVRVTHARVSVLILGQNANYEGHIPWYHTFFCAGVVGGTGILGFTVGAPMVMYAGVASSAAAKGLGVYEYWGPQWNKSNK